jgi:O-antigen/teichoic acid export membrane protein
MTASLQSQQIRGRSGSMVSSMLSMAGSEAINRFTRLMTAVALGWAFAPYEFGLAAIALTAADVFRAFTQTGIGARIIGIDDAHYAAACNSAYSMNWMFYLTVFAVQVVSAVPIANHFGDSKIAWIIAGLAIPYLIYPIVAVRVYRLYRQKRMKETALMMTLLLSGDNLLTAVFALAGAGLWSLVIPKILCAILWVIFYRRLEPWSPTAEKLPMLPMLRFGLIVLSSELATAFRLHADKFIIGHALGLAALGNYFFAYNTGLGIVTALITAATTALLPYFVPDKGVESDGRQLLKAVTVMTSVVAPIIILQSALARWYVPVIFGERWLDAVPIIELLCWFGIPFMVLRLCSIFLRARSEVKLELKMSALQTLLGIGCLLVALPHGLIFALCLQLILMCASAIICLIITIRSANRARVKSA